ncbi:hypothetical protein, conserved [Babesia bigemina]|uniref:Uncharacterized protein n=1 Tax=Babesia bigemina TaxID=5866 RepID=A0A061D626_BABBI|nr:hypothetical protein, conserved [Babesia bigemina]CDR94369.1 hypothetical protein, conserved [Babesia bigemina]|eukprot:XP_012766555.1 hypothetical protein, conserved [Babesia bigemina]
MYVPPAIRVTLGCAEGGRLARFARVTDPRHGRRIEAVARECEGHTGIPTTKAARRQLHELLDLGVTDTVAFIKEIAAPLTEAMDNRECLARNAAALAHTKSPCTPNKLRSKDVRVLKYRIRSLIHLLSPQDTAMLACALAHLDSRLGIMARPLIKHYIRALEEDTAHSINPGDTVVSLALMLTSLEMFVRTHSQQLKQVADGGHSERENDAERAANDDTSGDVVTEAGNYACNVPVRESIGEPLPGEAEVPLTVHDKFHYGAIMTTMLADCLKADEVNDVELMLLLAQCMGNISVPAALPSELVVQKVDLRDLDDNQLCKFTHACASIMTLHHVNLDGVIEVGA